MTMLLNTITFLFFAFMILSLISNEAGEETIERERVTVVQEEKEAYSSVVGEEYIEEEPYTLKNNTNYTSNMKYSANTDFMNDFRKRMGLKKKEKIVLYKENIMLKEEPLQKESLSIKEFIYQYIKNQNNSNYKENWKYIKVSKASTEKIYIDFWKSVEEQFILYEINEENQTFIVIIDYKNHSDEMLELHLKKDENQWFIINTKVLKRFDNNSITSKTYATPKVLKS